MEAQNGGLTKWAHIWQDFYLEGKVVRGTINCVADALSRRPEDIG